MVMMLPFLTAALAIWLALQGKRRACLWLWLLAFVIYAAWCRHYMAGLPAISL